MDTVLWGLLAGLALLGLAGLFIFILVFAAVQHAWWLFAFVLVMGAVLVLVLASGRERRPKWWKGETGG